MSPINTDLEAKLYDALKRIAREYKTPDQLRRDASRDPFLAYEELLEMVYENIQQVAASAIKGVRIVRSKS